VKPTARTLQNSIFDWDRGRWSGRLLWLIVFSLCLHFAGLYVFHVVYPSTTSLPPPAAQVSVLNPQNPQDRRLLDWVDLNDPSSISAPRVDESLVVKLVPSYRPTFSDETPEIGKSQASGSAQEAATPSLFTPDNLFPRQIRPAPVEQKTSFVSHLEFGPALKSRRPATTGRLPASQRLSEPTTFFAGISKEGEVTYLFLWRSSGSDQLDHLAEESLKRLKFQPANTETWDTISFHWGTVEPKW
jgi:hypothetical protein